MSDDVVLSIDGATYSGWTSLRITRGITQLANTFELAVTERFDGVSTPRPIRPGQRAAVSLRGERVMQGSIDVLAVNYDAQTHTLTVSGRDATGDLVDCAAIHSTGTWSGRTLTQIAGDLTAPFKIPVVAQTKVGAAFPTWKIEPGETVAENLDRAARYRGVLLMSDGLGNLLITQPGTRKAPVALQLGDNILTGQGQSSWQDRFSKYIVKAQMAGTDEAFGESAAAPTSTALDAVVTRYRPTIIMAEDQANAAACKTRAEWQRTVMAARSQQLVYTVAGWQAAGEIWQPNALVSVTDAFMGVDDQRLIVQVDFILDDQGRRTALTLAGKHAFDPIKLPMPSPHQGMF